MQKKTIIGAAVVVLALIIITGIYITTQQGNSNNDTDSVVAEETVEVVQVEDNESTSSNDLANNSNQSLTPIENEQVQPSSNSTYANGEYTTTVNYTVPDSSQHPVTLTLSLNNDVIELITVEVEDGGNRVSRNYQNPFKNQINSEVTNKDLDDVSLSRVGGASLTTKAFMEAIANIKSQAQN